MDNTHQASAGKSLNRWAVVAAACAALAAGSLAAAGPAQAAGPERALAGVSIFSPGSVVTRKFGNPNQILVGGTAPTPNTPGGASGTGGPGGAPGTQSSAPGGGFPGGGFPGSSGGGTGQLPGFPSVPGGFPGSSGGFPGSSGGFPGGGFPGGASGSPGGAAVAAPIKPPVTLIYNRANGGSLEFTISPDKRVVQIRETGYSGAYATARGIKLGTSYSAVLARYGYPEDTTISGSIINIDYKDTLHCGFQFLDQKLVGIIVSSPD